MYTDNGTNFVGARKELGGLQAALSEEYGGWGMPHAARELGSSWSTIPPGSPHWGGLWEAGVKSAKGHLKRILGKKLLSFEELSTVLCEVEAVLNSRPLVELTNSSDDLQALTPNMIVSGRAHKYVPLASAQEIAEKSPPSQDVHPQRRWKYVLNLVSNFWKRWVKEYLSTLQPRPKWQREVENLKIGDLVLVVDEHTAPLQWPLGRILRIFTGNDDVCRAVTVRTSTGTYNRPVVKIRCLPIAPDDKTVDFSPILKKNTPEIARKGDSATPIEPEVIPPTPTEDAAVAINPAEARSSAQLDVRAEVGPELLTSMGPESRKSHRGNRKKCKKKAQNTTFGRTPITEDDLASNEPSVPVSNKEQREKQANPRFSRRKNSEAEIGGYRLRSRRAKGSSSK